MPRPQPAAVHESQLRLGLACNLSCAHCTLRTARRDSAPLAPLLAQVDAVAARGVQVLRLTGGEPTLSPHLPHVLQRCAERGLQPLLETNGLLLASSQNRARLRERGLLRTEVYLPALDAAIYETATGQPRGLALVTAALDGLLAEGWQVGLAVPILSANAAHLPELAAKACERWPNLGWLRLQTYRAEGGAPLHLHPTPQLWQAAAAGVQAELSKAGVPLRWSLGGGLPACLLDEPAGHSGLAAHRDGAPAPDPACTGCAALGRCPGPPPGLLQAHPQLTLQPLTARSVTRRLEAAHPKSRPDDNYVRWLRSNSPRGEPMVREVLLRVVQQCNERCAFCWIDFEAPEMPDAVWQAALASLGELPNRPTVSITGGEPLLDKSLVSKVDQLRRLGIARIQLQTNATLATPRLARALHAAGVRYALVGLHAHTEALYAQITGARGLHARAVAGVGALLDAGLSVTVNCVIDRTNLAHLPDYARWLAAFRNEHGGKLTVTFAVAAEIAGGPLQPDVLPTLREVVGPLRQALDVCLQQGLPFSRLAHPCGVPPCLLDGDRRYYPELDEWRFAPGMAEDLPEGGEGKPETCRLCAFDAFCPGVREAYARRHGTAELVPIQSGGANPGARSAIVRAGVVGAGRMGLRHAAWLAAVNAAPVVYSGRAKPHDWHGDWAWHQRGSAQTEVQLAHLMVFAGATRTRGDDLAWWLAATAGHSGQQPWLLMEKPLGTDPESAKRLAESLERTGLPVWVHLPVVADPGLRALRGALMSKNGGVVASIEWSRSVAAASGAALLLPSAADELDPVRADPTPVLLDHLMHETAALDVLLRVQGVADPPNALTLMEQSVDEAGWHARFLVVRPQAAALHVGMSLVCGADDRGRTVAVQSEQQVLFWRDEPGGRVVQVEQAGVQRTLDVASGTGSSALVHALVRACSAGTACHGPDAELLLEPVLTANAAAAWHARLFDWWRMLCDKAPDAAN